MFNDNVTGNEVVGWDNRDKARSYVHDIFLVFECVVVCSFMRAAVAGDLIPQSK